MELVSRACSTKNPHSPLSILFVFFSPMSPVLEINLSILLALKNRYTYRSNESLTEVSIIVALEVTKVEQSNER